MCKRLQAHEEIFKEQHLQTPGSQTLPGVPLFGGKINFGNLSILGYLLRKTMQLILETNEAKGFRTVQLMKHKTVPH